MIWPTITIVNWRSEFVCTGDPVGGLRAILQLKIYIILLTLYLFTNSIILIIYLLECLILSVSNYNEALDIQTQYILNERPLLQQELRGRLLGSSEEIAVADNLDEVSLLEWKMVRFDHDRQLKIGHYRSNFRHLFYPTPKNTDSHRTTPENCNVCISNCKSSKSFQKINLYFEKYILIFDI